MTAINHRTAEQVVLRLLAEPDRSNARVAASVGCDRRCVRRYRAMIQASGITAAHIEGLDATSIWTLFNGRPPVHSDDTLGFNKPDVWEQSLSAAERWRRYRDERKSHGLPALSQRQFARRWLDHVDQIALAEEER